MTEKEIGRRNGIASCLVGAAFAGLGIYDLRTGDFAPGALFLTAGVASFLPAASAPLRRKRGGAAPFPPGRGSGKNG